jgi:hypothetical protein
MNIKKRSISHLKENNMQYQAHFKFAFFHGCMCIKAGLLLIIHAIIPALYPKAGSILVNLLNKSFTDHNDYLKLKKRLDTCEKKHKDGK